MIFNVFLFAGFIVLSAFFSASETAIFSLTGLKLQKLSERYRQAKIIRSFLKSPTRLLSTIVFGNMLVNIGISSLLTAILVDEMGENGLFFAIFLSGIFVLFFGEIFPKTFAMYMAERLSLSFSPLLQIFSKIFSPLIAVIEKITEYFSSFLIRKPYKTALSEEELKATILLSKKDGQISAQEEDMISHVLEFKDTTAGEVLTARIDIKGIDTRLSQKEVIKILCEEKHSKFPVYKDSLDNIIGILYAKDFFLNQDKDYHDFLREPVFIPGSKGIDDVLKIFLEKKERLVIVVDEYGGTEGIVTLEDVVEEIFGEIYDEFETVEKPLESIGGDQWRIYGKVPVKTVNLELGLDIPEQEDTIAGFLLSKMEKIPHSGETLQYKNVEFIIERVTARRIINLVLKINRQEKL